MRFRIFTLILFISMTVASCGNRNNNQGSNSNTSTDSDTGISPSVIESTGIDSSKIRRLEAFTNIDLEKAYASSLEDGNSFPDFSSAFTLSPEDDIALILFITSPDCSACIASTLDFLSTNSRSNTCPTILFFKEGNRDIYEFYKEQYTQQLDSTTRHYINHTFVISVGYSEEANNAPDGAYLLYRNRVINYMPWSL